MSKNLELMNQAVAFQINGKICGDWGMPMGEDDEVWSFYIYGENGLSIELYLSTEELEDATLKDGTLFVTTALDKLIEVTPLGRIK